MRPKIKDKKLNNNESAWIRLSSLASDFVKTTTDAHHVRGFFSFFISLIITSEFDSLNRSGVKILYSFFLSLLLVANIESKRKLSDTVINLEQAIYKKIELTLSPLEGLSYKTYRPCNPSICKTDEGYIVICRTLNYEFFIEDGFIKYRTIDYSPYPKTKNVILFYDKNFQKLKEVKLMDHAPRYYFNQIGLEDCRIFKWGDEYWFTATTYDTPRNNVRVALGNLKNIKSNDIVAYDKLTVLDSQSLALKEKNWLPWIINNELFMIYSFDPFAILKVEKNGTYKFITRKSQTFDLSEFRGSAAPISFNNGYLLLVHEVVPGKIWPFKTNMYYYHRFVYLDSNLNIQKISNRVSFKNQNIEYVCGMTMDHSNKNLIIGLGIWDREAYLCTMSIGYVNSLLHILG